MCLCVCVRVCVCVCVRVCMCMYVPCGNANACDARTAGTLGEGGGACCFSGRDCMSRPLRIAPVTCVNIAALSVDVAHRGCCRCCVLHAGCQMWRRVRSCPVLGLLLSLTLSVHAALVAFGAFAALVVRCRTAISCSRSVFSFTFGVESICRDDALVVIGRGKVCSFRSLQHAMYTVH